MLRPIDIGFFQNYFPSKIKLETAILKMVENLKAFKNK
jgi:hypothetical protein